MAGSRRTRGERNLSRWELGESRARSCFGRGKPVVLGKSERRQVTLLGQPEKQLARYIFVPTVIFVRDKVIALKCKLCHVHSGQLQVPLISCGKSGVFGRKDGCWNITKLHHAAHVKGERSASNLKGAINLEQRTDAREGRLGELQETPCHDASQSSQSGLRELRVQGRSQGGVPIRNTKRFRQVAPVFNTAEHEERPNARACAVMEHLGNGDAGVDPQEFRRRSLIEHLFVGKLSCCRPG